MENSDYYLIKFTNDFVGVVRVVERQVVFSRAERVEIPASIPAVNFYQKFGYGFKNDVKQLDEEGHFRLGKFK